jgi:hypothetical protein
MRIHTTHSRDAALRELHRINRWMIAGSVLLAGLLSDVAAHSFPGKHLKTTTSARRSSAKHGHASHSGSAPSHKSLTPPSHAPRATQQAPAQIQESPAAESQESAPTQESAPAQESAPVQEPQPEREAAPAQESAPAPEPAPEPEAPVVSGGS